MTTALQLRRGTTAQHSTFTGLNGEVTADTTLKTLRVHDGATAGGFPLARLSDIVAGVRYDSAQSLTAPQRLQARSNIAALLEPASNGIVVKTAAGTTASRALVAGTGISITNTDGVGGDITISSTITAGVTSVNGKDGVITAAQIAEAAVAGLGYTPAGSTHTHSAYVSTDMTHGAVGSLCFATVGQSVERAAGSTVAGSLLVPAGVNSAASILPASGVLSGTWRLLGYVSAAGSYRASLFQRIS